MTDEKATPHEPDEPDGADQPAAAAAPVNAPAEDASRSRAARAGTRRVALTGLRLASGVAGVAVAVAVIAAVGLAPAASGRAAPGLRITPEPAPLTRVCPGALLALGGGDGQDAAVARSVGRANVVARALGAGLERSTLTPSASGAQLLTASAGRGALLAGAQSQSPRTEELRGLATAACGDPVGASWLVGGATTTGRTSLVTLSNPTAVEAIVDLRIWTEAGAVRAPGLRGIRVPAGAQKVLSLAGFAPDATSPVVEVSSTGGRVLAALQQSILRALDPGGVDIVASSGFGTRLTIPGVEMTTVPAVQALRGRDDYQDLQPVIRLLDPGDADTTVRIRIRRTAAEASSGTAFTVRLTAGTVLDVPIDSLAAGSYTVTVESDAPVAAAARVSSAQALAGNDPLESPISDLAWIVPAPLVAEPTAFAAPPVPSRLHVVNPGAAELRLALRGEGTPDLAVTVPAGEAARVELAAGGVYRVDPPSGVRLQVVSGEGGQIAAYPVAPPPAAVGPIVIRR